MVGQCVYDGAVCRTCCELKIQCTQNTPRKRRGPPNQYVVADIPVIDVTDDTQRYVQAQRSESLASSPSASPVFGSVNGLDQLAPFSVIEEIIRDWFELIHSVCPIFHHATFIERLNHGDLASDSLFSSVVVSVCAATIASLRRKRSYGSVTVERCLEAFGHIEARAGKRSFTLEWCQTRYNLSVAVGTVRGFDDEASFHFISEAVIGLKYLLYYKLSAMPYISQQLLKRLYWLVFAGLW